MEYFHVQHTLFGINDKIKYIKNPYTGKKIKAWNRPTKLFPNKWKRKLAQSDKDLYYNQGKWINGHKYRKGQYYNECYDDDLNLETTGKSFCTVNWKLSQIMTLDHMRCFLQKKNTFGVYL